MPRKPPQLKLYRGRWLCQWRDATGKQRWQSFGNDRETTRREAQTAYSKWLGKWLADEAVRNPAGLNETYPLSLLCDAYESYADRYYRRVDGTATGEANNIRDANRVLREYAGEMEASRFGLDAMKRIRGAMVEAGLARTTINQRVQKIIRMFRWGAGEGLVPSSIWHDLAVLEPIKAGRTEARESESVRPVSPELVARTLRDLRKRNRTVADMIRVQLLTGARVSETCEMRADQINTALPVWEYHPGRHKNQHRDHDRTIYLGPRAQKLVARRLSNPDGIIFPTRTGRPHNRRSYYLAIYRTFTGGADDPNHWHPNQLRHTSGTRLRARYGLEAAAAILGHRKVETTQLYAEISQAKARQVAGESG